MKAKKIIVGVPLTKGGSVRLMTHYYIREKEVKAFIDSFKAFFDPLVKKNM